MLKYLTSRLSSRAKNEIDSSQLLSIKTLQKAENHRILPQLEATLQIFPPEFATHSLRNPLLKDMFGLNRDIEILHLSTLQAPVLACSLGYFDKTALFRNPRGNPPDFSGT